MTTQTNKVDDPLVYAEPVDDCNFKMGTFYFTAHDGVEHADDFYIKTCGDVDKDKQFEDYNEQLTDEWERLTNTGCTQISYKDLTPCPIY